MIKFYFIESQSFVEYSPTYMYILCLRHKLETKVMRLHKIRVKKIPLFHLKKCAVNYL